MRREAVSSSNIESIGYDEESMTLEVEFRSGMIYQYFDVPFGIHEQLMGASSHGEFLASQVKGTYRYARI